MKQIILPVTIHLNIRLPHALLQPESADAPTGPEPEAHVHHRRRKRCDTFTFTCVGKRRVCCA